jgi:UDP-N-acetylglucosamine/UDP-N-acetylgalactosamine diphosphorylase
MKSHRIDEWSKNGVTIGSEVDEERIADDVVLHPGCRVRGAETSIGPGCVVGEEAPATIEDCQLGREVRLKGGYFAGATFFEGANMGSGAHVRGGTILEEQAGGAHTVGLKQTVLLPFVTLGSLINFCDILMAGGTNRRNHSEVGSSFTHFNYTPHQDKATPSLLGDVAEGVFLDKQPIFLGGQGGLVGPVRIAYGTILAAGGICRQDLPAVDRLHIPRMPESGTRPYEPAVYGDPGRIVKNNLLFIGNLFALKAWYRFVRQTFMCRDRFEKACLAGGLRNLDIMLAERIRRLGDLAARMNASADRLEALGDGNPAVIAAQRMLHDSRERLEFELTQAGWKENIRARDTFLTALDSMPVGGSYIETIQSMDPKTREAGRSWLQSIIDEVAALWPVKTG